MEGEVPEENQEEMIDNDSDWDNRVLCSDGNCIGVIGSDGSCKECGKEYEGDLPPSSADLPPSSSTDDEEPSEPQAADSPPEADAAPKDNDQKFDDDWENRVLCSDGNCIGVIGPDGKCKECGKPLE